jgi:hypothetical protein
MDALVCPDDGETLKVDPDRVPGEMPVPVGCPTCGKRFTYGSGGLRKLPAQPEAD